VGSTTTWIRTTLAYRALLDVRLATQTQTGYVTRATRDRERTTSMNLLLVYANAIREALK
jgi:hypothetical protein